MRKFLCIAAQIQAEIADLPKGTKLAPLRELTKRFGVADLTVRRALKELEERGAIVQKVGNGTFTTGYMPDEEKPCGLLISGSSYSEVFSHIRQALRREANRMALRFIAKDASCDNHERAAERALQLAGELIDARVGGVIFQPIQFARDAVATNTRILRRFADARIPVVIIDCELAGYTDNNAYDLISIDNFSAGQKLAVWLLSTGSRHICFQACPNYAPSVTERIRGLKSVQGENTPLMIANPDDAAVVGRTLSVYPAIDTIICQNDLAACRLRKTLSQLGYDVPGDIRLAGFDGVKAHRGLVTMRQPCEDLARCAIIRLLERMSRPESSAVRVQLQAVRVTPSD